MNYRPLGVTQAEFCNPLPGRLPWLSDGSSKELKLEVRAGRITEIPVPSLWFQFYPTLPSSDEPLLIWDGLCELT